MKLHFEKSQRVYIRVSKTRKKISYPFSLLFLPFMFSFPPLSISLSLDLSSFLIVQTPFSPVPVTTVAGEASSKEPRRRRPRTPPGDATNSIDSSWVSRESSCRSAPTTTPFPCVDHLPPFAQPDRPQTSLSRETNQTSQR